MASTNPARGMRDFLPGDVRKREYVIGIIKEVYESYGFEPLETPAVENIETLTGKYGEEGNQLIFKILKRGEKLLESVRSPKSKVQGQETLDIGHSTLDSLSDLALRYDLTVPLARVIADRKNELPKFFRRYQIQPVWRADRPARGRFREFYQCDVDCIGSESIVVEADLILAVTDVLKKLGFQSFAIPVNHRSVLFAILEASGIPENKHGDALIALDKVPKIGPENFMKELEERGMEKSSIDAFGTFMSKIYEFMNDEIKTKAFNTRQQLTEKALKMVADFIGDHEKGIAGLARLKHLFELTGNAEHAFFDVSLARGISYYTGSIFEVEEDLFFSGSLGGGGRYDRLIGMFGKEQIPACGFSLGLERILVVMEERGMFPPEIADSTAADVLVTIWNDETIAESLKLASELRSKGLRVTVYPEARKLGKQMKYADSIKVPWVCVLRESEIATGKVTLKDMKTGEQETLNRDEVAAKIA